MRLIFILVLVKWDLFYGNNNLDGRYENGNKSFSNFGYAQEFIRDRFIFSSFPFLFINFSRTRLIYKYQYFMVIYHKKNTSPFFIIYIFHTY